MSGTALLATMLRRPAEAEFMLVVETDFCIFNCPLLPFISLADGFNCIGKVPVPPLTPPAVFPFECCRKRLILAAVEGCILAIAMADPYDLLEFEFEETRPVLIELEETFE